MSHARVQDIGGKLVGRGFPVVAWVVLTTVAAEKTLWVREPKTCVAAEVPVAGGKGTILFSQLDVQRHVNRSKPGYDPAAERILVNMMYSNREE